MCAARSSGKKTVGGERKPSEESIRGDTRETRWRGRAQPAEKHSVRPTWRRQAASGRARCRSACVVWTHTCSKKPHSSRHRQRGYISRTNRARTVHTAVWPSSREGKGNGTCTVVEELRSVWSACLEPVHRTHSSFSRMTDTARCKVDGSVRPVARVLDETDRLQEVLSRCTASPGWFRPAWHGAGVRRAGYTSRCPRRSLPLPHPSRPPTRLRRLRQRTRGRAAPGTLPGGIGRLCQYTRRARSSGAGMHLQEYPVTPCWRDR
jgi:hypothetical protein